MENITEETKNNAPTIRDNTQNERTFTQDEVNRIVQERLNKERSKVDAAKEKEFADREAELARKEFRIEARKELYDRGLPEELLDALNISDKDTFENSLEIIEKILKPHEQESEKNEELERNKARFTMPMNRQSGADAIRAAMGLK